MQTQYLYQSAYACLMQSNIKFKVVDTFELHEKYRAGFVLRGDPEPISGASTETNSVTHIPVESIPLPGRPKKPELVEQQQLPRRKLGSEEGRAAFIHAICHIEFNAINLALDAVYRFRELPDEYYRDWLKVAKEEAEHFQLLNFRLGELGYQYGDFLAHNGLWDMACRTEHDSLHRMALVPRVLEARGLDVTPGIIKRLQQVDDVKTVEILELILREEIEHVKIGNRWYMELCRQRGVEPVLTFRELIREYYNAPLREPLNYEARIEAGFTEQEIRDLTKPFS